MLLILEMSIEIEVGKSIPSTKCSSKRYPIPNRDDLLYLIQEFALICVTNLVFDTNFVFGTKFGKDFEIYYTSLL